MENLYLPQLSIIDKIVDETSDTKTFTIHFADREYNKKFRFKSGQFVEASVFGVGEAPFGFASNPNRHGSFDITVRAVGAVTRAMHDMKKGDVLGIRAPLGNSFPLKEVKGLDILIVAGGIGLPPLKSLIDPILDARKDFGRFIILYGARTPADRVYKPILEQWSKRKDITLLQTVDNPDDGWSEHVGVVTTLFEKIKLDVKRTVAYTCGPPIMIRFVIQDLLGMGFPEDRIISTLERYMKCGVGKCGHCAIGHKYICVDGPVFSYQQIKRLPER
ncbi:FAD/NAD(P)-binding protein [candidate division KSB1 bacterium]|nr:FAD/NAD(P)-binding protein [candidate division KSB1 bacterium]